MGSLGKKSIKRLSDLSLTLFFTEGVGLKTWADLGSLNREISIYQRLTHYLKEVNFVSYGGAGDKNYGKEIGKIHLFPIPWNSCHAINLYQLFIRHWRMIEGTDVIKTNQIKGAEIALWFKRRFGKKLIVRCGYLLSRFAELNQWDVHRINEAKRGERKIFLGADIGVVSSNRDRNWVIQNHGIPSHRVRVIPNYVDMDIFSPPNNGTKKQYDLVYVGRSDNQKNLRALLGALVLLKTRGRNIRLLLIGGCSKDEKIKEMASREQLDITFMGNIPNSRLPQFFAQVSIFILPSLFEGTPKVLLEAMSYGLPCIGSDVEGINNFIYHRENGYLSQTDSLGLSHAINTVLSNRYLRERMGTNARKFVKENFCLEKIMGLELDLIQELAQK